MTTYCQNMDPNRRQMTDSVLNLTLEIIYLLTGEGYTVVKKTTGRPEDLADQSQGSDGWSWSQSHITAESAPSPSQGEDSDRKVLELANRIIHFLTGEVWQYLIGHKDLVRGVGTENSNADTSEETNNAVPLEELGPSSAMSTPSHHTDNSCPQIKNEPGSLDEDCIANSKTSIPLEPAQHATAHIKLETVSCDTGHLNYTKIYSSNNCVESSSAIVKEEYPLNKEGDDGSYQPTDNGLASFPGNGGLMETSNTQVIDSSPEGLSPPPDFENSLPLVERNPTYTPLVVATSQIPNSDSGIRFSDTPAQEGHVCSKCSKCFSTQLGLFWHKKIHAGLGKKDGGHAEAASTDPAGLFDSGSPEWTGVGQQLETSTNNGSSRGSNLETISCDNVDQGGPVNDGAGQKSRTCLKYPPSESYSHRTALDLVDPWKLKKASCVECGEVFPSRAQLVLHQKNHFSKLQFSCSECSKCFTSNSHLVVHQRVHTGEKPFGCPVCPKRFATKSTLVIHQRVHTREKPYSCTECRKCFPCNSQLVIHQRTHTGEKPYSCIECGKGFISNSDLLRHRRVHTGERPFKCSECAKCFSQKSHLREHQKTHRR